MGCVYSNVVFEYNEFLTYECTICLLLTEEGKTWSLPALANGDGDDVIETMINEMTAIRNKGENDSRTKEE
jgi:hypothetical protein